jgi:hypothetical protein
MSGGRVVADGAPADVLSDVDMLHGCRLVPTSLLELNLKYLPQLGRFMSAEALAHAGV